MLKLKLKLFDCYMSRIMLCTCTSIWRAILYIPGGDSDDDFEDVPEKEGYEAVIPPHKRKEYGM